MAIKGVDISSHQGPGYAYPDWAEFAVIKASGGHSYVNEYLNLQVKNARSRNIEVGFYHYMFEPSYGTASNPSGGDVQREADNFIQAVELVKRPGDTLWLDVEEYGRTVGYTGYLGDWCVQFCDLVGAHFGCTVGIYTATWFLLPNGMQGDSRLARYPLWFASWQDDPPAPVYLKPWAAMTMWQFNADDVDKDLFYGSREDWRRMGIPGDAPPPPPLGNEITPHVLADGRPAVTIAFAGRTDTILGVDVADLDISVASATEAGVVLDQSVQGNRFGGWRVRAPEPAPAPEPPPPPPPPPPAPEPAPQPQPEPEVRPVSTARIIRTFPGASFTGPPNRCQIGKEQGIVFLTRPDAGGPICILRVIAGDGRDLLPPLDLRQHLGEVDCFAADLFVSATDGTVKGLINIKPLGGGGNDRAIVLVETGVKPEVIS